VMSNIQRHCEHGRQLCRQIAPIGQWREL